MTRSVEETKKQLMAAATTEFAARGPHGTTMEQIAKRAGVNKERLYAYYGEKFQVFAAVLAEQLAQVADAVPLDVLREAGAGEYAGRSFDYLATHPELSRLLHWEALTYGDDEVPDEARRTAYYQQKVETLGAIRAARGFEPNDRQPDHLFSLVFAIVHWWFGLPQLARMLARPVTDDRAEYDRRRATVVAAATLLIEGAVPLDPSPGPVDNG